jgi:excinuclease ABC subunit C
VRDEEPLDAQVASLPVTAGVYLFEDRRERVLYVGKAANLRARVRQYVGGHDERFMVPFLMRQVVAVRFVATRTEKEALLLENTLIKQHRPRYNTKLVDDKNFLHLRVDPKGKWPRFTLVRRIKDDRARYFGPYSSASKARETVGALGRHFPLRTCSDATLGSRKRPCILHQMGRCAAPCVGLVDEVRYGEILDDAMLFLDGRTGPLVRRVEGRMVAAAEAERFEDAARLRDLIRSVSATVEPQQVVDHKLRDRDVWGLYRVGARGVVACVPVRDGFVREPVTSPVQSLPGEETDLFSSLLLDAYAGRDVPPEILLPVRPTDADAIEEVLTELRGAKVAVRVPERGDAVRLVELAGQNAKLAYDRALDADVRLQDALTALGALVGLAGPPHRIECFDNSNLQGDAPVAAMSVLIDGRPAKDAYRRYKIKTVVGADDFASMREILGRRVTRGREDGDLPDLLVIDGGHGQVNAAMAALADVGVSVPLVGIRKPRTEHKKGNRTATDVIIVPGVKDPIVLKSGDPRLRLLQLARDEVHNHAVRYHRKVRQKEVVGSVLDDLPGVGKARRTALLRFLGSVEAVVAADEATLASVPGIGPAFAKRLWASLHG